MSFLLRTARLAPINAARNFTTSRTLSIKVDSNFISQITAAEKKLTNSDEPVQGGPTAQAQSHVGQELTSQVIHDITAGEKVITNSDEPVRGGPTSVAQSMLSNSRSTNNNANNNSNTNNNNNNSNNTPFAADTNNTSNNTASPASSARVIDSPTLSAITAAEKQLTGKDGPVRRGPTAQAQKHVGEPVTDQVLSDIQQGEQNIKMGATSGGGVNNSNTNLNTSNLNSNSPRSNNSTNSTGNPNAPNPPLDSSTLSTITSAEKRLTGQDGPVPGGPTARAQQHANEPITSQVLHDITEGEKNVTGGERVKGGPTSRAQSVVGKARQN